MDSITLALLFGLVATFIAGFGAVVEIYSIRAIDKRLQREHDYIESRGTMGEQFLDSLYTAEDAQNPESPLVIDALAMRIAHVFYKSQSMASAQEKSVRSKIQNKWDGRIGEALKNKMPPQMKLIQKGLEWLGIDIDINEIYNAGEMGEVTNSMKKAGLNPMEFMGANSGNNGNSH